MTHNDITIAYWGDNTGAQNFAACHKLSDDIGQIPSDIERTVNTTTTKWILFWHFDLGSPDNILIHELSNRLVDVFHTGLKLGVAGLPEVMNYVDPTWMYNIDCDADIEHTSFRLSLHACLIRTTALKQILPIASHYTTIEMLSIATGYKLIKTGALIRYIPNLVKAQLHKYKPTPQDEWTFAREFYTTKWQTWIVLHKPGLFNNLRLWYKSRNVKRIKPRPAIHNSQERDITTDSATISILAPTLDRYPYLKRELEQLSVQTLPPHEILITDQTDLERRETIHTDLYPSLNIRIFPQIEKGQCIAWNKLLEESTSEYVFFVGDDADHITPDFLQRMLHTMRKFNADMVASNVIEIGIPEKPINHHYYLSDTFPITLIKKSMLEKSGYMDMFFNRNVRADKDLATRCHLNGCLMIFNPTATIHHHRAPVGGLRAHKARVITGYMSKNSITRFALPTSSEIYFTKKYFNDVQYRQYIRIKYLNQLFVSGSILKSFLKVIVFLWRYPGIRKQYYQNLASANEALQQLRTEK
jgi:Glycosyltransferases involved in cell wall biogenesis